MSCPHCVSAGRVFGRRVARRDLRRLRRKGPSRTSRMLIDALVARGVEGASVIDVGAGIGSVHLGLLEAGADRAVAVDASRAYQDAARKEAEERGVGARVTHVVGDFLDEG